MKCKKGDHKLELFCRDYTDNKFTCNCGYLLTIKDIADLYGELMVDNKNLKSLAMDLSSIMASAIKVNEQKLEHKDYTELAKDEVKFALRELKLNKLIAGKLWEVYNLKEKSK